MIIQMTEEEGELYRAWLSHYGESTPETRTQAFFNARALERPPLNHLQ